jgi:hypothetical protein
MSSGDDERLRPSVGSLDGTLGLLYPGKTHMVSSEPEAGKTWLALMQAAYEMSQGRSVLYIDHEDDARSIVARLLAMGVEQPQLLRHFHYVRPEEALGAHPTYLEMLLKSVDPSLVIIDGVTEAMTLEGFSLTDNQDAAEFFKNVPTKMARLGPAVLLLDHEVKRARDSGRYALGAGHKLAAISGAAFKLRLRAPFAVGSNGASTLVIVKDRPGLLRRREISRDGGDAVLGYLRVASDGTDFAKVDISREPPPKTANSGLDGYVERVLQVMERNPAGFDTKGALKREVGGNASRVTDAINALIADGIITQPPILLVDKRPTQGRRVPEG